MKLLKRLRRNTACCMPLRSARNLYSLDTPSPLNSDVTATSSTLHSLPAVGMPQKTSTPLEENKYTPHPDFFFTSKRSHAVSAFPSRPQKTSTPLDENKNTEHLRSLYSKRSHAISAIPSKPPRSNKLPRINKTPISNKATLTNKVSRSNKVPVTAKISRSKKKGLQKKSDPMRHGRKRIIVPVKSSFCHLLPTDETVTQPRACDEKCIVCALAKPELRTRHHCTAYMA